MKPTAHSLVVVATMFILSACGSDSSSVKHIPGKLPPSNDKVETSSHFSYEFKLNECTTGKHQLTSKEELCEALQNNTLNNGCAVELREIHFQSHCQDQTFEPFTEPSTEETEDNGQSTNSENSEFLDHLDGDNFNRELKAGQSTLILHKTPDNGSAKTVVYCLKNNTGTTQDSSSPMQNESDNRVMHLTEGSVASFLKDPEATYEDGSQLPGKTLTILCK